MAVSRKPAPVVPIRKSVTPDAIIWLEDGKAFKSLRRHLHAACDMSPEDYRAKWGLPHDYPMVAPGDTEARSVLAKSMRLGPKRRETPSRVARAPLRVKSACRHAKVI